MYENIKPLKVNIISDIHYYSKETGVTGKAFEKENAKKAIFLCEEISKIIVVFLNFVVRKFGPAAIFMLLCRTFATYGIDYLKPALTYFV